VAHHAGVTASGETSRAQISRYVRSNRTFRTRWPLGELADPPGPGPGVSWFEARMASCAAAHGLRPRFRKAGGPVRHRVAAPCACSPTGRGARSRTWRLRVRIPPGTPGPRVQRPDVPCKDGSRGWHSAGAPLGNGVTGSLLAFEATRCASESRFPSSCLFSDNGQHAALVRR
jgi:hypothetical protein